MQVMVFGGIFVCIPLKDFIAYVFSEFSSRKKMSFGSVAGKSQAWMRESIPEYKKLLLGDYDFKLVPQNPRDQQIPFHIQAPGLAARQKQNKL